MSPNDTPTESTLDLDDTESTKSHTTNETVKYQENTEKTEPAFTVEEIHDHPWHEVWGHPSTRLQLLLVGGASDEDTAIKKIAEKLRENEIGTHKPITSREQVHKVSYEMLRYALDVYFSKNESAKRRDEEIQPEQSRQMRVITVSSAPIRGHSTVTVTDVSYTSRAELIPQKDAMKVLEFGKDEVWGLGVIRIPQSSLPSIPPGKETFLGLIGLGQEDSTDDDIPDEQ